MTLRISRLGHLYAWKRFRFIYLLFTIVMLLVIAIPHQSNPSILSISLDFLSYLVLLSIIIKGVCSPKDSFSLERGKIFVAIFSEEDKSGKEVFHVSITRKNSDKPAKEEFYVTNYNFAFANDNAKYFVYQLDDGNWYCWQDGKEKVLLGQSIDSSQLRTISYYFTREKDKTKISLTNYHSVKTIYVDALYPEELVQFPEKAEFETSNGLKPWNVVFVKNGDKYACFEFYHVSRHKTRPRQLAISPVTLLQDDEYITLAWDTETNTYKEVFL